jgi:hypothetical protein
MRITARSALAEGSTIGLDRLNQNAILPRRSYNRERGDLEQLLIENGIKKWFISW